MSLPVHPIGIFKTRSQEKFEVPHQPDSQSSLLGTIELNNDPKLISALKDLEGFSHIWIIWWFHRVSSWKSTVLPPRGPARKRGLFATRSPHRPNPIGISVVPLLEISKNIMQVGAHDLIDGTPILDIKPYLKEVDSLISSTSGWVGEIDKLYQEPPRYQVIFAPLAQQQRHWLETHLVSIFPRAVHLLCRDPSPHRTRRIQKLVSGEYKMACGGWRIIFELNDTVITINQCHSGYPLSTLRKYPLHEIPDGEAHVAFQALWSWEL